MSLNIPFYQIDAFASSPFEGNPAAVCLCPAAASPLLTDRHLQLIAAENNLSETAFLVAKTSGNNDSAANFSTCTRFDLRWFTPTIEVPLCGHATLAAAAAVLFGAGNPADALFFDTLSGELSVRKTDFPGELSMDLPLLPPSPAAAVHPDFAKGSSLVGAALGSDKTAISSIVNIVYEPTLRYLVVVLARERWTQAAFEAFQPDVAGMHAAHGDGHLVGVILTVQAEERDHTHDFYYRFFGPWAGIAEDPVTGSANSVLGPVWMERLQKRELAARQCSKRGGELRVVVNAEAGRVVVVGGAVIVIKGEFCLDEQAICSV